VRRSRTTDRRRDSGVSLIEILIAVVLMGSVVAGSMAALRATIIGGVTQRDHARAHAWLQTASDILYAAPKVPCDPTLADGGEPAVRASYDSIVDAVPHPPEWRSWQIRVIPDVDFWNAANLDTDPDIEYFFGPGCDPSLGLQLIELEVRAPNGEIIETVEIVK
jgi:prepilin-type N-terminal cleavage/methylation domain-containing protein